MPRILADVWIFDPVSPFQKIAVQEPAIETYHDETLITSKMRQKLPHLKDAGKRELHLPFGTKMSVSSVEIGVQIGEIKVHKILALVVDDGHHDLLIGGDIFRDLFDTKRTGKHESEHGVDFSPEEKEDPSALSIELYPLETPFPLRDLECAIRNQRVLYNISLIAEKRIQIQGLQEAQINDIIDNDAGIPKNLALQVSYIDRGSIWLSFTSGCANSLKYLGSLFETGASAKLSAQMAESKKAENDAEISEATRDSVAQQIIAENDRLRAENLHVTYDVWRSELLSQLTFLDKLIEQSTDEALIKILKQRKNEAIMQMADQQMVPVVRNIPGSYVSRDTGVLALPAPPPRK